MKTIEIIFKVLCFIIHTAPPYIISAITTGVVCILTFHLIKGEEDAIPLIMRIESFGIIAIVSTMWLILHRLDSIIERLPPKKETK